MIGNVSKHPKSQPEEQIRQTTVVQSNLSNDNPARLVEIWGEEKHKRCVYSLCQLTHLVVIFFETVVFDTGRLILWSCGQQSGRNIFCVQGVTRLSVLFLTWTRTQAFEEYLKFGLILPWLAKAQTSHSVFYATLFTLLSLWNLQSSYGI